MGSRADAIDVHAHLVQPGLLTEAERNPRSFGEVEVRQMSEGRCSSSRIWRRFGR